MTNFLVVAASAFAMPCCFKWLQLTGEYSWETMCVCTWIISYQWKPGNAGVTDLLPPHTHTLWESMLIRGVDCNSTKAKAYCSAGGFCWKSNYTYDKFTYKQLFGTQSRTFFFACHTWNMHSSVLSSSLSVFTSGIKTENVFLYINFHRFFFFVLSTFFYRNDCCNVFFFF